MNRTSVLCSRLKLSIGSGLRLRVTVRLPIDAAEFIVEKAEGRSVDRASENSVIQVNFDDALLLDGFLE